MKTLREMMDLVEAAQQPHQSNTKNPVDFPRTWHDVDPKLGKQVDKMSQAEKVKKGLAHPDTLKKKGVAEAERQPGRFSGAWQILVNGKKVHSFRGNFDQETADRVGVVKAASRGLYNPGSGDKIKIVPVMLDQKQGVAEEQVEESSPDALSKIDELFRK